MTATTKSEATTTELANSLAALPPLPATAHEILDCFGDGFLEPEIGGIRKAQQFCTDARVVFDDGGDLVGIDELVTKAGQYFMRGRRKRR